MTDLREMVDARHETLILEALDWDIPCVSRRCRVGNPSATHVVHERFPCGCAKSGPVCADCVARAQEWIAQQAHETGPWRCKYCYATMPVRYVECVRFEPLP